MQRLFSAAALCLMLSASVLGCHDNETCGPGEPCDCYGGHECYVSCEGDGCNPRCYQMEHCGAVCEDKCISESFDVQETSTSCGDDCFISCHNAVACGAICGDRCHFDCHDMNRCGVSAGNDSEIDCHNYTTCAVECAGTCHVKCASPANCDVKCPGGAGPAQCADGRLACGGC